MVAYMRLVLMNQRKHVLQRRWKGQTVNRMLATLEQLAERLTEDERIRAERLAEDWRRRNGRG